MRLVVSVTIAAFIAFLLVTFYFAEKAHPQMIDVDPAAEPARPAR